MELMAVAPSELYYCRMFFSMALRPSLRSVVPSGLELEIHHGGQVSNYPIQYVFFHKDFSYKI